MKSAIFEHIERRPPVVLLHFRTGSLDLQVTPKPASAQPQGVNHRHHQQQQQHQQQQRLQGLRQGRAEWQLSACTPMGAGLRRRWGDSILAPASYAPAPS